MNLSRRSFLGGCFTVAAIAAVPAGIARANIPTLYADGWHCDADAVEAMSQGCPFRTLDGFVGIARDGLISNATLYFRRPVTLTGSAELMISNCVIMCTPVESTVIK